MCQFTLLALSALILLNIFPIALFPDIRTGQVLIILDPGHGGKDWGGYNRGFIWQGKRISENAYNFDVAKRIKRAAEKMEWQVAFTLDDTGIEICDFDEDRIIPHKSDIKYNFPNSPVVFPEKEGLLKRLGAIDYILGKNKNRDIVIFISVHFDYTDADQSGSKIFIPPAKEHKKFAKILAQEFAEAGFGLVFKNKKQQMVEINRCLVVLRESDIVPRVFLELGNFNNDIDKKNMLSWQKRETYAQAIIDAVKKYIQTK